MSNVVGFAEARSAAFEQELRRLDDEYAAKREKISKWPSIWFDTDADQAFAIDTGHRIAAKLHCEGYIAAFKRFGFDTAELESARQDFPDIQIMSAAIDHLLTCSRVELPDCLA